MLLMIDHYDDPLIDNLPHLRKDIHGTYAEWFWLPTVGPTALWMLRRLDLYAEAERDEDLAELCAQLGVRGAGRHSAGLRALLRLKDFGLVFIPELPTNGKGSLLLDHIPDAVHVHVRRWLPPITARRLERLTPSLQAAHSHHRSLEAV